MFLHLYFRLNEELIKLDHNPFQWNYSSFMPYHGLENPLLWVVSFIVKIFISNPVLQAYAINSIVSASLLCFLSWSAYAFFVVCHFSLRASLLASLVVSFTGFHLTGVRLFNYMYLQSFVAVGPIFVAFLNIQKGEYKLFWMSVAGLAIGLSLIGGSNSPLFYYLPFTLLLPFFHFLNHKNRKTLLINCSFQFLSIVAGIAVGAATVLPGLLSLKELNRSHLQFSVSSFIIPFKDQLVSLFIRDWGWQFKTQYYESDCFLGLPVLGLTLWGLYVTWKNRKEHPPLSFYFLFLILTAFYIMNLSVFPGVITFPISWLFEILSIRNPSRFFLLALYPIAYFVAQGFDSLHKKKGAFLFIALVLLELVIIQFALVPYWPSLLPDTRIAAFLSLSFGFLSTFCLLFRPFFPVTFFGIYLMYFFAPIQLTNYSALYKERPQLLEAYSPTRLEWQSLLGLKIQYDLIQKNLDTVLLKPSQTLSHPETTKGRIWDLADASISRVNFFAPQTKHHFAFTALKDPASPLALTELFQLRNEGVLDMYGICWKINYPEGRLLKRNQCLPEAFLVAEAKLFQSKNDVLSSMQLASSKDFQSFVYVNCTETDCSVLKDLTSSSPPRPVQTLKSVPGEFIFDVHSEGKNLLFFSTVFHTGWQATFNERPVPLLKANHAFMAVPVEGNGRVRLVFENGRVFIGRMISVVSFVFLLLLARLNLPGKKRGSKNTHL